MGRPKGSKNRPKTLTPAEEEARARRKSKALEKARAVRIANAHKRNAELIWKEMGPRIKASGCRCGLKKGMTLEELRELGAGCTSDHDYYRAILKQTPPWAGMTLAQATTAGVAPRAGSVCPILDAYRRYLERPQQLQEAQAA
jgi:hypothetical protein